ncbi:MAG: hypothetical protein EZS28_026317, partial [Streblomastix strix]
GEDFSTDMSSDELESNNRLIFTTLQQPTAKIHVNNKRTRRNSDRRSKLNLEEGTSMDSPSYPSPSSSSEEDQRRADRSKDNSSPMARPDMVHRTGKRECSIPYAWLEQRNSGTRNIVNQEEFETFSREDMLFPDGPKVRKGRRFARKILRILNISKGTIDMNLCGQRYISQRRYYYAIETLKKRTKINHNTIIDQLTMKLHIIIIEVFAQFTSVNTSTSSAIQFLNGLSSMLPLIFGIDLKDKLMLQFTRKAISAHMIVKPKYEDTWNVRILFDYLIEKSSNRNLTNIELQTKLTSLLMTICSMRPAEIEGISLKFSQICEQTDKIDQLLQTKTKSGLHSHKLQKTRDRIVLYVQVQHSLIGLKELTTNLVDPQEIVNLEHYNGKKTQQFQPREAKSHSDQRNNLILKIAKWKQVYSFKHLAATQLVVMGLGETQLNTYTGHARNSKLTNEYYVFAERLKDNETATNLSDSHGLMECNPILSTQQSK